MFPAASAMMAGVGGVFTPLEPYRRPKPIKTGLFSFSSRPKAVPKPYRTVPSRTRAVANGGALGVGGIFPLPVMKPIETQIRV
jgi:hypothetical protein